MPVSPSRNPTRGRPGPRGRLRTGLVLLGLAALLFVPRGGAAEREEPPDETRAPMVSLDALPLGMPWTQLDDEARKRAEGVLGSSLFSHRVSGLRASSREPVFRFLLDHPDFAAAVARALRLGKYHVEARDGGYWGDDRRGARGTMRVLYADEARRLYHLAGTYDTRGLPTIQGQMLLLIEFVHTADAAGRTQVEASVTGHVKLDSSLVGTVAQLATTLARPAVEQAIERKVRRFFGTVARVSHWAYEQPEQLWAALEGHPEVPPSETLVAFREILLADRPPAWASEPFRLLPAAAPDDEPESAESTSP